MTTALALLALAPLPAEIRYHVALDAAKDRLDVSLSFAPQGTQTVLQMPSWSPGYYVRTDPWKSLDDLAATDDAGRALTVLHTRGDSWAVETSGAKTVTVRYSRPAEKGPARLYEGPSTYLYLVGHKEEPCALTLDLGKAAIGLERRGKDYVAKDYDDLADAPVTFGEFVETRYVERGKEHLFAFRGRPVDVDRATRIARFVTQAETEFFGGAPYERYVWHADVALPGDRGGGLEHKAGVELTIGDVPGPRALHGMAHEFFHLWNVKRIRPADLGPFDYTAVPKAGALWWLEGVTDYYASLLPYRYGGDGVDVLLGNATQAVAGVRAKAARLEVSPFEAGDRIPEANNSNGYRVDYYQTGWLLGLMLDAETRDRTDGKRSLDDVELALWKRCQGDKPGFGPDEIRKDLVKVGGDDLGDLYDDWVTKPGDLPVEATIAKLGLALQNGKIVLDPSANAKGLRLREAWLRQKPLPGAAELFR